MFTTFALGGDKYDREWPDGWLLLIGKYSSHTHNRACACVELVIFPWQQLWPSLELIMPAHPLSSGMSELAWLAG